MDSDSNKTGLANDKQWAKKYLLDPLTAPEPSQETGPGSSFIRPVRRRRTQSLSSSGSRTGKTSPSPKATATPTPPTPSFSNYSTPPSSASPTSTGNDNSLHHTNPFRRAPAPPRPRPEDGPRSSSGSGLSTPLTSPTTKYPPSTSQTRNYGNNSRFSRPGQDDAGDPRLPSRSPPAQSTPNPFMRRSNSGSRGTLGPEFGSGFDSANSGIRRSASTSTRPPPPSAHANHSSGIRRNRSLSERFAGDMSHRPLDMIKRETRAADRAPHIPRKKYSNTDQIDVLDNVGIGGAYHHGGPYDATLAARNMNPMYSPVAAVQRSNMEALKATPREYVKDALKKHVPLQGTAMVPPGERDFAGRLMEYEEGADLMREKDAPGGAYKRWEGRPYLPEDLKGKGEPSYSIEKAEKERRRLRKSSTSESGPGEYEMQPGTNRHGKNPMVRQRSVSSAAVEQPFLGGASTSNDAGVQRSNTTGKKLGGGLKKRLGSLRRRKAEDGE